MGRSRAGNKDGSQASLQVSVWSNGRAARDLLVIDTDEPDSVVLHVEARNKMGEPRRQDFRDHLDAISVSVAELRAAFGGDEGAILDDFGRAHPVSLTSWADRDPATSHLVFSFSYQQRDVPLGLRGSVYPPDPLARVAS